MTDPLFHVVNVETMTVPIHHPALAWMLHAAVVPSFDPVKRTRRVVQC